MITEKELTRAAFEARSVIFSSVWNDSEIPVIR